MPDSSCKVRCEPWIFDRIHVLPLIRGGTRVEWSIHPRFRDPSPYLFQLQVGRTSNPLSDDWEDVGEAVEDTYFAEDPEQRLYGMGSWTHYRIQLTTSVATYLSNPASVLGDFDKPDWTRIQALSRQLSQRLRKKAGTEGYLLKRRIYGEPCTCLDQQTGEVRLPNHDRCYGTGIVDGYFDPYPCYFVEFLSQKKTRSHVSDLQTQNDGPVVSARMLNVPMLHSYDVFVDKGSDQRWIVHKIEAEVEVRGVPVILAPVELRLAPFSHIIYTLPIADQQAAAGCPS